MALHHPDYLLYPNWVIFLPNQLFHKIVTVVQRMKATNQNLAGIRALIDCLEYEYLRKRQQLDEEENEDAADRRAVS